MYKIYLIGQYDPMPLIDTVTPQIKYFRFEQKRQPKLIVSNNYFYYIVGQQVWGYDWLVSTKNQYPHKIFEGLKQIKHITLLKLQHYITTISSVYNKIWQQKPIQIYKSNKYIKFVKSTKNYLVIIQEQLFVMIKDQNNIKYINFQWNIDLVDISPSHMLWVQKGILWGMGCGMEGQLGGKFLQYSSYQPLVLFEDQQIINKTNKIQSIQQLKDLHLVKIPFKVDKIITVAGTSFAISNFRLYKWGRGFTSVNKINVNKIYDSKLQKLQFINFFPVQIVSYNLNLKTKIYQLAASDKHAAAIDIFGNVYSWGKNVNNCLGLQSDSQFPTLIPYFKQQNLKVKSIACGEYFTIVLQQQNYKQSQYFKNILPINDPYLHEQTQQKKLYQENNKILLNQNVGKSLIKKMHGDLSYNNKIKTIINYSDKEIKKKKKTFKSLQKVFQNYTLKNMKIIIDDLFQVPMNYLDNKNLWKINYLLHENADQIIMQAKKFLFIKKLMQNTKKQQLYSKKPINKYQRFTNPLPKKMKFFNPLQQNSLSNYSLQKKYDSVNFLRQTRYTVKFIEEKLKINQKKIKQKIEITKKNKVRNDQQQYNQKRNKILERKNIKELNRKFMILSSISRKRLTIKRQRNKLNEIEQKKLNSSQNILISLQIYRNLKSICQSMKNIIALGRYKNIKLICVVKIQRIFAINRFVKYFDQLKQKNRLKYLKFRIQFRHILNRLHQKRISKNINKIITQKLKRNFCNRIIFGVKRFENCIRNIQLFAKYSFQLRTIYVSKLSYLFDQQLMKRSQSISRILYFQFYQLIKDDPKFLYYIKKIWKKSDNYRTFIPPFEFNFNQVNSLEDLKLQKIINGYQHIMSNLIEMFGIPNPNLQNLTFNLRQIIYNNKEFYKVKKSNYNYDYLLQRLSSYYYCQRKLPKLNLKTSKFFTSSLKLNKEIIEQVIIILKQSYQENINQKNNKEDIKIVKKDRKKLYISQQFLNKLNIKQTPNKQFCTILISSIHLGKVIPCRINNQKQQFLKFATELTQEFFLFTIQFQLKIKFEILLQYLKFIKKNYIKNIYQYIKQINEYAYQHKEQINLIRSKLLLHSSSTTLQKVMLRQKVIFQQYQQNHNQFQVNKHPTKVKFKDHLPYGSIIFQIVNVMPNSPKKPEMIIELKNFQDIYQVYCSRLQFVKRYAQNSYFLKRKKLSKKYQKL